MDNRSTGISAYQLGIFLIVTMVGLGFSPSPWEVVEIADTDGWMLVLSSGAHHGMVTDHQLPEQPIPQPDRH